MKNELVKSKNKSKNKNMTEGNGVLALSMQQLLLLQTEKTQFFIIIICTVQASGSRIEATSP